MKIGVFGAGISGLSIARLLNDTFDVEILEKKDVAGGIARTKTVDGIPYHLVGGHCFNSKHQEVLDFVFNEVLPIDQWQKIKRKSRILFRGQQVDYPIEFSIKDIYNFDKELAINAASDFLSAHDDGVYSNLEEWFIKKFGKTLSENYFIPYNTKIWNNHPKQMSHLWVEDKLPIPNKFNFFESLIGHSHDNMPHAQFYYPVSNNQNTFIDNLAKDLNVIYNYTINEIKHDGDQWIVNDDRKYDLIISTLPLKELPFLIADTPEIIKNAAKKLKYNGISNVLWKTQPTDKTWTYIPEKEIIFHRYIHIGSFISPQQQVSISEVVGEHSFDEMKNSGQLDPFLIEPLDFHTSDYAYVVFDENYQFCTSLIKNYLQDNHIHTLGRFGEWQYYNMDICIKQAIDLSKKIIGSRDISLI